jgi:hypothetical protein
MASSVSQSTSAGAHPSSPASQAQRTEEAKAAFTASLSVVGSNIDAELQSRAKVIHGNAENLKKQDKKVQNETNLLSKENDVLEKFVNKAKESMPELDSFED